HQSVGSTNVHLADNPRRNGRGVELDRPPQRTIDELSLDQPNHGVDGSQRSARTKADRHTNDASPSSLPNSVGERTTANLCFARLAKRSFAKVRSDTEFRNEVNRTTERRH